MSTSISLTLSDDQDSKTSKSFSGLKKLNTSDGHMFRSDDARRDIDEFYERRHTGLGVGSLRGPASIIPGAGKLKRWDEQNDQRQDGVPRGEFDDDLKSDGFYLEVDDKMSRNSYEYPEQQAKYIEKWLDTANTPHRSKSFGDDSMQLNGNIVGIRGFPSESVISDNNHCKASFNKLKRDHLKLKAEYKQLISRRQSADNHNGQLADRNGDDLDTLRAIVIKQGEELRSIAAGQRNAITNVCDRCKRIATGNGVDAELEKMRFAKNQFALKLAQQEQEHTASVHSLNRQIEQLKLVIQERNDELVGLKNQVRNLSLESDNRKLLALSSENQRLKETGDIEMQEHYALKENYSRLEQKLRSLIADQKCLNSEHHDEIKEVLLELCKLQVYLPKLEMILETETQIKLHLQTQLSSQQEENDKLNDQIATLRRELNETRLQARSKDSCDVERFRNEVLVWRDKCDHLKQEYSDLNELFRSTRSRLTQQDVRLQDELQQVRESCQRELDRAKADQRQAETKLASLEGELSRVTNQLDRCKSERDRANEELLLLHQRLEEVSITRPDEQIHIKLITNKLRQCEQTISALKQELSIATVNNKELAGNVEMAQSRLEHSKQQYNELKRRFELQQTLFEELKEKRDREVAKLRLDLNLEQYNRQTSLKGIEKELRSSLRELEAMKYRFSKRLSIPSNSSATINTTVTTCTDNPSSSNCKRTVKFNDQPKLQTTPEQTVASTTTMQLRSDLMERQQTGTAIASKLIQDSRRDHGPQ